AKLIFVLVKSVISFASSARLAVSRSESAAKRETASSAQVRIALAFSMVARDNPLHNSLATDRPFENRPASSSASASAFAEERALSPIRWAVAFLLLSPVMTAAQEKPVQVGDSSQLPQGKGDIPFLERTWEQSLFTAESKGHASKWIDEAIKML